MAIKKQEFYEGAALHQLARTGLVTSIKYDPPLFTINDRLTALLKYSTKGRSPWGFTFMPSEQALIQQCASETPLVIALICGADGIAAIPHESYVGIAIPSKAALHVACYREHRGHYTVSGPDGVLTRKVAPSDWTKVLSLVREQ